MVRFLMYFIGGIYVTYMYVQYASICVCILAWLRHTTRTDENLSVEIEKWTNSMGECDMYVCIHVHIICTKTISKIVISGWPRVC